MKYSSSSLAQIPTSVATPTSMKLGIGEPIICLGTSDTSMFWLFSTLLPRNHLSAM